MGVRDPFELEGKVVITGGSRGLGLQIAKRASFRAVRAPSSISPPWRRCESGRIAVGGGASAL